MLRRLHCAADRALHHRLEGHSSGFLVRRIGIAHIGHHEELLRTGVDIERFSQRCASDALRPAACRLRAALGVRSSSARRAASQRSRTHGDASPHLFDGAGISVAGALCRGRAARHRRSMGRSAGAMLGELASRRKALAKTAWLVRAIAKTCPTLLADASTCSLRPSLNEGISNTILEAMARGCRSIAHEVGGNVEIVEEGGRPAFSAGRRYATSQVRRLRRSAMPRHSTTTIGAARGVRRRRVDRPRRQSVDAIEATSRKDATRPARGSCNCTETSNCHVRHPRHSRSSTAHRRRPSALARDGRRHRAPRPRRRGRARRRPLRDRHAAPVDHRPRRRPPAARRTRTARSWLVVQRRDLQLPRAARASSQARGPPLPDRLRLRGRRCTATSEYGDDFVAAAERHVRLRAVGRAAATPADRPRPARHQAALLCSTTARRLAFASEAKALLDAARRRARARSAALRVVSRSSATCRRRSRCSAASASCRRRRC